MTNYLDTLREMRERAMEGGGAERIAQQHARGKMTARERLALLLDEGTFQELGALATHNMTEFGMDKQRFPGDGVVTGFGKINGRRVAVFAQDFTVVGGSFSEVQANKICRLQDVALESGIPMIGLNDSGGPASRKGFAALRLTAKCSCATFSPPASFLRSLSCLGPARAARSTLRP